MPNRPCKTDADLKRLWQTLLPGVAMPACGVADGDKADAADEGLPTPQSFGA
jgi:hypothetical protein